MYDWIKKIVYKHKSFSLNYEETLKALEDAKSKGVDKIVGKFNFGPSTRSTDNLCSDTGNRIDAIVYQLENQLSPRIFEGSIAHKPYIKEFEALQTVFYKKSSEEHELYMKTRYWGGNMGHKGQVSEWMNIDYEIKK